MKQESMLTVRQIKDASDPLLDQIRQTYEASFPEAERRCFSLLKEWMVRPETVFSVYAFLQDETYVGFITAWDFPEWTYIEHFAIDEKARNGGIGGRALKQFIAGCRKAIVLEVELPSDELSKRRVGFYERLGFSFHPQTYYQPPYREEGDWLEMRLMSQGAIDWDASFEKIRACLYRHVYGVDPTATPGTDR